MMRSPAFHITLTPAIGLPGGILTSVAEGDEGFCLDDSDGGNSEHGSELGPLPVSSPTFTGRRLRQYSSSRVDPYASVRLSEAHITDLPPKAESDPDSYLSLFVYGLVNVAVSVPCLYGYAGIIYRDPAFQSAMPDLTKLVILSSAIHQLVFTFKSTLSFSVAQVQDAGLIFLSSMATSIAMRSANEAEAVSTAVVVLSLATAALGIVIVAVGKFRLASFVSLIPMPVVAGYLAFIGFFCLAAGIGLSCSKDISNYQDFAQLNEMKDWILATPALLSGGLMVFVSRKSHQWWALPATIVVIPILFFVGLYASNCSLEEARLGGWVAPLDPPEPFYNVFKRFDFGKVNWTLVPKLVFTWASMTLLVTFASALDVVAVEMDLGGQELDLDAELKTVGWSNVISGILGGYTGSYIFSMTIFTRRTGSKTRWIGIILALVEIALFCAPFNLMSYVPRFFFAATLIFIAFDLMMEWLIAVAFRVSYREYFISLLTFFAITFAEDLVLGILIGCLASVVNFISLYSSIDPVLPANNTSNVLRDYEARKILRNLATERVTSLRLSGFLFFGSTTLLLRQVRGFITQTPDDHEQTNHVHRDQSTDASSVGNASSLGHKRNSSEVSGHSVILQHLRNSSRTSLYELSKTEETPLLTDQQATSSASIADKDFDIEKDAETKAASSFKKKRRSASVNDLPFLAALKATNKPSNETVYSSAASEISDAASSPGRKPVQGYGATTTGGPHHEESEDEIAALETRRNEAPEKKTRYLVLDFNAVTGVDATAVSTGLLRIRMLAKANNVKVVFSALNRQFEELFRANHVLDDVVLRQTLNDALDYCETEMLDEIKVGRDVGSVQMSLRALHTSRLLRYPHEPSVPPVVFDEDNIDPIIVAQKKRAEKRARASLALLVDTFFGWGRGQPSMSPEQSKQLASYFVLRAKRRGSIIFDVKEESDTLYVVLSGEVVLYKVSSDWEALSKKERQAIATQQVNGVVFGEKRERIQRAKYGSMIGDLSFALQERRAFGALAERDTTFFVLTREKARQMEAVHPELSVGLYKMLGRSLGMTLVNLQQLVAEE